MGSTLLTILIKSYYLQAQKCTHGMTSEGSFQLSCNIVLVQMCDAF